MQMQSSIPPHKLFFAEYFGPPRGENDSWVRDSHTANNKANKVTLVTDLEQGRFDGQHVDKRAFGLYSCHRLCYCTEAPSWWCIAKSALVDVVPGSEQHQSNHSCDGNCKIRSMFKCKWKYTWKSMAIEAPIQNTKLRSEHRYANEIENDDGKASTPADRTTQICDLSLENTGQQELRSHTRSGSVHIRQVLLEKSFVKQGCSFPTLLALCAHHSTIFI
jgi:hypothetical protein